jgi:hypothetical protein
MKFRVTYQRPKKKEQSIQNAVFYDLEDAIRWEKHVQSIGCTNTEVIPVMN